MSEEKKPEESTRVINQADYDSAVHRARTFEGKLVDFEKKFEKFGGIDKALELIAKPKEPEAQKVDVDSIRKEVEADIRKSVQADLEKFQKDAEEKGRKLHSLEVVDKVRGEWSGKFLPSALPLITDQYIRKYVDKDAEGFLVKDDEGKIRYKGAIRMTTEDLFKELADRHPDLLQAEKAQGVLPKGEVKTAGKAYSNGDLKGMTPKQMIEYFKNQKQAEMQAR